MIIYTLFFGLILRLISINQSLWLDETTSAIVARDYSFNYFFTNFLPHDFHPPLYYLVLKLWAQIFGTGEVALRLPSVIFALITIYIVYKINKIASLLLATSPLHIYYSQEARMYSLSTLLVAASVYFFIKILKKSAGWRTKKTDWIIFSLTLPAIFLTDYLPLLILPVFFVYLYFNKPKKIWLKKFILSLLPLVLSFIIFLPIFKLQLLSGLAVKNSLTGWWVGLGKTSLKAILLIPIKFITGRIDSKYALLGLVSLIPLLKTLNKKYRLYWYWLITPIVLTIILGNFVSVLVYFRLLFVLPAFYILIATGLSKFNSNLFFPYLSLLIILNIIFVSIYYKNSVYQREDWRGATNYINKNKTDKTKIIFPSNSQMEAFVYYKPEVEYSGPSGITGNLDKIFLMRYVQDIADPSDQTRQKIESLGYNKTKEDNFNGVVIWEYSKNENSN